MDAKVKVNSFEISLKCEIIEPKIVTAITIEKLLAFSTVSLSFAPIISVGGHSISAVTPDLVFEGGLAVAV